MSDTKYQLNDVVYFAHNATLVKGVVEEKILHYTQEKLILKYIIRPYGFPVGQCITVEENDIYTDLESCRQDLIADIKKNYTKVNIKQNYKTAKKQMREKYEKQLAEFDDTLATIISNLENLTDKFFDEKETNKEKGE